MPTAYGAEFRQDVIDVARKGEAQIPKDFVSPVLAPSYSGVAGVRQAQENEGNV